MSATNPQTGGYVEALHDRLVHAEAGLRKLADEEARSQYLHGGRHTARFDRLDSKRRGVSLALSYVKETLREQQSGRADPQTSGTVDDDDLIKVPRAELRAQMLNLISAYSEEHWAAGWMSGVENDIRRWGGLWLVMAWACGGWPKGYRARDGWEPLSDTELAEIAQTGRL